MADGAMVQRGAKGPEANDKAWHAMTTDQAMADLGVVADGLASDEAARRLALHGPNVLERVAGDGPLAILWRQINSPLIWVLLASSAVAIAIGKVSDGLVVLAVVVLNSLVGFVQEYRASRAIESLRGMVPEHATALRDGARRTLPVADLVPGDVVLVASGDKVPADIRLLAVKSLQVEEAALTGESVPVQKQSDPVEPDVGIGDRRSLAFGGTLVTYGTGTGLVIATGRRTELGRISTLLQEATELQTPLTRALASIGRVITIAIIAVSAAILALGVYRATGAGLPLGEALRETLTFAIALAVGAIPEGLPAIVTIALAIGVQRMAARRAIIRKLPAVETLGSTTVICSDKTGTLTRNEMTVVHVWIAGSGDCRVQGVGYDPTGTFSCGDGAPTPDAPENVRALLAWSALCSDATLTREQGRPAITGDPTEAALVVAAEKAGVKVDALRRERPRLDAIPFESENQFMATLHDDPQGPLAIVKGAPEVLVRRCRLGPDALATGEEVLAQVERLASEGMRVLAVATRHLPAGTAGVEPSDLLHDLRLAGLVGMIDPPRAEAVEAVADCRRAGIAVKMITGDHKATAQAIGQKLGLAGEGQPLQAYTGVALSQMDDQALAEAAQRGSVFARVAPEHKLRLVQALQGRGQVVAMTGDGVNDAPALKQANIGVAMGITGTSVSKEAADMVLTDDNFATIVAAVEEGRRVYDNLVKSLAFVLPTNLGLAFILMWAVLFFPFDPVSKLLLLPIQPTQILWINLVATVSLALPLAFEAREPDVMRRPPRNPAAPVLSSLVVRRTVIAAVLMTGAAVGLFRWEFAHYLTGHVGQDLVALAEAQTMAVTTVISFQAAYLFHSRSLHESMFRIGLFSNPWVFGGLAAITVLQAAFIYAPPLQAIFGTAPLGSMDLGLSVLVGVAVLPLMGLEKWLGRRLGAGRT